MTSSDKSQQEGPVALRPLGNSQWRKFVSIGVRYAWIAATVFVVVMTIGALKIFRTVPVYQAVAKVLVERQSPRVMKFDDLMQPAPLWGDDYYKTQMGVVNSRAVMDLALQNPRLKEFTQPGAKAPPKSSLLRDVRNTIRAAIHNPVSGPAEPWQRLRAYVYGEHVSDTQFLRIKAEHSDRSKASIIANAVAKAFVEYHVRRKHDITGDAYNFLSAQRDREEVALRAAQAELAKFRDEAENTSFDVASEGHPVFKRLARVNEQLTETEIELIELTTQLTQLQSVLNLKDASWVADNEQIFSLQQVRKDGALATVRAELREVEHRLARLSGIYGPDHPQLRSATRELDHLRETMRSSLRENSDSLAARVKVLHDQESRLKAEYSEQNDRSVDLVKESVEFVRLQNDVERHQQLLDVLVGRMREVELSGDYERSNVELVELAAVPRAPIRPRKLRSLTLTALLACLLAIAIPLSLEYLDDTIRTPEELEERVGINVLGFVPHIARRDKGEKKGHRLIVMEEPDSSAIEAYRNIRTSLLFIAPADEVRTILVTSGGPGDGKTTTACNLAAIMANSGKRILLIDMDMRRPTVHRVFGLENETGLTNLLVGDATLEEAVQKGRHGDALIDNLDVMTTGTRPPNPTELIEAKATRRLIDGLRDQYDRIIIDSPPVLFVADASLISTFCDGVVLVARSAKNARSQAVRARRQLDAASARVLGGILNDVTRWSQFYSEYYYYGYSRYYKDYYTSYYSEPEDEAQAESERAG